MADETSGGRGNPGPALTPPGESTTMFASRPNASSSSPSHGRISLEGYSWPLQFEAAVPSRRTGAAMTDHGGTADDLSHINLADENGCAHAMNLQAPHVMSGGGVREDTTTAMIGEGGQQDDGVAGVEQRMQAIDKVGQTLIVPKVGLAFDSEDSAYDMYNAYAPKVGFSVRKSHTKRRGDKSISQKYIVCSNEGHRDTQSSKDTARTGCEARIQFSVNKDGIWTVQKLITEHNHYLASPNKVHKLRSQRRVIEADRHLIGQIREAGMKPSQVYDFMIAFYGGPDKVPFSKMDCNNEIGRERKKYLESNNAQTLLEYLKNKQREDPTFFMPFR
ncbi:protein FAR1-RELATED SEQUENCE 5 [Triticum aestivum]|uniref:protein FAR1-RELATED SEQUENCE 5 n=1 Tax=Triticum aestivum TaxID=4565 RepID=UPI001D00B426|nr:protein FAR1-RELATED SEQUENCE 5-like [Triticum aestivum]XP_044363454.1 protein FAR1-RELATED SEQUENCE 5-like [Triticum aestivum]XP_044363455.1 protein FAR1-RELATED SEQUENCE 5-like [Triticum aestivum]